MNRTSLLAVAVLACLCPIGYGEPRALSLEEALALSEDNAEALRIRELAVEKNRLRVNEARAKTLPRVTLEASGSYLANPPEGITVKAGELGSFTLPPPFNTLSIPEQDIVFIEDAEPTYFSLSASVEQPVFTWGKITSGIRLSNLELAGSRAELEQQKLDLRREVHRSYFGALLAEKSLPVLESMAGTLAEIASDRERQYVEGLITRRELLEARARQAEAEHKLMESREALSTALQSLSLLTGIAARDIGLSGAFRDELPALDEEGLTSSVLRAANELELARTRIEQAREKLALEQGGALLKPDLAISVTFDLTGQKIPYSDEEWSDSWNWDLILSLGTSMKAFDGGEARSRIGQARKDLEAAGFAASQAEKLLRLRVRKAIQEARSAFAELGAKRAAMEAAREQNKSVRASFDNELATREELGSSYLALGAAELEELSAEHRLECALAAIEYLCGYGRPQTRTADP